ncbi:MAG: DUF1622 domain-containing protein [Bacilli bacterium]|nr:DUF1622 domain-containing protein [Bacillales bacterium]MDY2575408.1 DUF1622 domain-containing protein [Bacilli bacterium]
MFLLSFKGFLEGYESILENIASFAVITLELIGIIVIIIGAFKSIAFNFSKLISKNHHNIRIDLGQSLALGLEFKMGAEIIKTVLVRDLQELLVLAFIIALRAGLAVLIHWEIKLEKKEASEENYSLVSLGKNKEKKKEEKVEEKKEM